MSNKTKSNVKTKKWLNETLHENNVILTNRTLHGNKQAQ